MRNLRNHSFATKVFTVQAPGHPRPSLLSLVFYIQICRIQKTLVFAIKIFPHPVANNFYMLCTLGYRIQKMLLFATESFTLQTLSHPHPSAPLPLVFSYL